MLSATPKGSELMPMLPNSLTLILVVDYGAPEPDRDCKPAIFDLVNFIYIGNKD